MIDFLMILSSLILHEGGAKTSYSSSGEEALPSHSAALDRAGEMPLGSLGSASDRSGGTTRVGEATGMSRVTITKGKQAVQKHVIPESARIRQRGGGRKPLRSPDAHLLEALNALIDPVYPK